MIEALAKAVDSIVALQAGRAERQEMDLGKDSVHLTVAGIARVCGEGGDILVVTVGACERFLLGRELVSV